VDKRLKHLNALRSFESAARHQSYSKAAQELCVSQGAVSQQMRQLAEGLGLQLFVRSGRSMQLTQSGEKLYQTTSQALNFLLQGINMLQNEELAGELVFTSSPGFCSLWLMPRLHKFSTLYPEINVRVLGSEPVVDLRQKQIDVAVRFFAEEKSFSNDDLQYEAFGTDFVYPVCSPDFALRNQLTRPEDLVGCHLVNLDKELVFTWQQWFNHAGVANYTQDNNKTEVTSSDMALSAVLSGHAVALMASAGFSHHLQAGRLVVPFAIMHPKTWQRYLVYDASSTKLKRIKVFSDWIRQEMTHSHPSFITNIA
jgi:LysR family glycine cleavage system transcriptional activator